MGVELGQYLGQALLYNGVGVYIFDIACTDDVEHIAELVFAMFGNALTDFIVYLFMYAVGGEYLAKEISEQQACGCYKYWGEPSHFLQFSQFVISRYTTSIPARSIRSMPSVRR